MESRARSQSNLVIRQVNSFPRVNRFNDTIIPMFWAEYVRSNYYYTSTTLSKIIPEIVLRIKISQTAIKTVNYAYSTLKIYIKTVGIVLQHKCIKEIKLL